MKMLYDRANGNAVKSPKHLLLMGKGTYDNRRIFSSNISGKNLLLTLQAKNSTVEYSAYGTDDYFGFLTDHAGVSQGIFYETRAQMNISVGRLPVKTLDEANQVVDKLCTYIDDKVPGKWKSQILFLADDGDHGLHVPVKNAVCLSISSGRPPITYIDSERYTDVGMLQLLPLSMNGMFWSRKSMADEVAKGFLGERYMRFDPVLPENIDLDNAQHIGTICDLATKLDITHIEEWIIEHWF
jgi:hypothetical protein